MEDTNYKLRAWMGANKVSGVKLSEMIDMPYDTFKARYAGKTQWKLTEIVALLRVTGLTFDELF